MVRTLFGEGMQKKMRGFLHSATDDEAVRRSGRNDGVNALRSGRNDGVQLCRVGVLTLDGFGLGADCVLDVLRG
jgi:hypothetical protein